MDNDHVPLYGYIARPVTIKGNGKGGVSGFELDKHNRILIDFAQKGHSFIVASSGSGKSYLAGVYAEELVERVDRYGLLIIDPLGIFGTLGTPNTNRKELDDWNEQVPNDIVPARIDRCTVWVPDGDSRKFLPGMFNRTFGIGAPDFTTDLFAYAYSMDISDPQVSLFNKCHKQLVASNPKFSLWQFIEHVREHGREFNFQKTTVEALTSKLDALGELGIICENAPALHELVGRRQVSVLNLSQTSKLTARIIVEFLVAKIHATRTAIKGMVDFLRATEDTMPKMPWYIPPVQLLIDEAHRYINGRSVIELAFSEGRNIGLTVTAISQSANLTEDVYKSLWHLWIGPQVYDPVIQAIREMIPARSHLKPADFNQKVNELETGYWIYFNIKDKKNPGPFLCRVRPRKTLHLATTEVEDEDLYFTDRDAPKHVSSPQKARVDSLEYTIAFNPDETEFTAVCKGQPDYKKNERRFNVAKGRYVWVEEMHTWTIDEVADEFLTAVAAESSRTAALKRLQGEGVAKLTVIRLRNVEA